MYNNYRPAIFLIQTRLAPVHTPPSLDLCMAYNCLFMTTETYTNTKHLMAVPSVYVSVCECDV